MESVIEKALRVGRDAASHGFDWDHPADAVEKIREECSELIQAQTPEERIDEFGDLMFAVMNVARQFQIDPTLALAQATRKFESRFAYVHAKIALQTNQPSLEMMEVWWDEAKRLE